MYDATAGSWVYGSTYQSGLYLNSGHTNYVYVYGYTSGESYSVTVTPSTTTCRPASGTSWCRSSS